MIVLGIDPGSRRIGYGLIEARRESPRFVRAGILAVKSTEDARALREVKDQLDALIRAYKPGLLALERLYFGANRKTAIRVAETRGVILLAGAEHDIPIEEYAPNEIKAQLAGYGFADKAAVLKMVRLVLEEPSLRLIDDASDALAVALVASRRLRS